MAPQNHALLHESMRTPKKHALHKKSMPGTTKPCLPPQNYACTTEPCLAPNTMPGTTEPCLPPQNPARHHKQYLSPQKHGLHHRSMDCTTEAYLAPYLGAGPGQQMPHPAPACQGKLGSGQPGRSGIYRQMRHQGRSTAGDERSRLHLHMHRPGM